MKKREYGVERNLEEAPESLDNHIFFGLTLDNDQIAFRNAIWDRYVQNNLFSWYMYKIANKYKLVFFIYTCPK